MTGLVIAKHKPITVNKGSQKMSDVENAAVRNFVSSVEEANVDKLHDLHVPTPTDRKQMEKMMTAVLNLGTKSYECAMYSASLAATIAFKYVQYRNDMDHYQGTWAALDVVRRNHEDFKTGIIAISFHDLVSIDSKIPGKKKWVSDYLDEVYPIAKRIAHSHENGVAKVSEEQYNRCRDIITEYDNREIARRSA